MTDIYYIQKRCLMIKTTCSFCGKEFEHYPSQKRKYCSKFCSYGGRSSEAIESQKAKKCPICGNSIHRGKTYCSIKCWHKSDQFKKVLSKRDPKILKNATSFKKGNVPWNKGKTNVYSEDRLEKIRIFRRNQTGSKNSFYGKTHTEKTKKIISEKAIERFKDVKYKENIVNKLMKSMAQKPNKLESMFINLLKDNFPGKFKYVGNGKIFIEGLNPDFFYKDQRLLIELFGCYWHGCSICHPEMKHDDVNERIETFAKYGFKTLIIWEHEMKAQKKIIKRIKGFLNGRYCTD